MTFPCYRLLPGAAAALLLLPAAAAAHETLHEIRRGDAIAVRGTSAHGEPLAGRAYQVYAPADPGRPWQEGRTDPRGWLAFVPGAPGSWRVRIADEGGHGLDLLVDAGAVAAPASTAAFLLRPLLGAAVIGALFAGLHRLLRRRSPAP